MIGWFFFLGVPQFFSVDREGMVGGKGGDCRERGKKKEGG